MAQVDFYTMLSGLGDTIAKQRTESARKQAFADINNPDGTVDFQKAILGLTRAGDVEGAARIQALAGTMEDRKFRQSTDARDFAFKQQEAQRTQKNADRTFTQSSEKPTIQRIKDPSGNESLIRVMPDGTSTPIDTGVENTPTNPYAYGKQNETQSKDSGYANRMFDAEKTLRDPSLIKASQSWKDRTAARNLPSDAANWVASKEYRLYDQAARNFINATLRRESGAAISQSEFDNAYTQYLPQPSDGPEELAQKQRNRQTTIAGIAGGGGQSYRPPITFGPAGEMVPSGNPGQGATPPAQGATPKVAGSYPPAAVAALKANPKLAAQFDQKYGQGAAMKALGGQ